MKLSLLTLMLWTICIISLSATIPPEAVAILYNTKTPESLKLAEMYREARHIPQENLIGLELPVTADISRDDYEQKSLNPCARNLKNGIGGNARKTAPAWLAQWRTKSGC
ncbi:MAG: hypothetical protein HC767_14310 [Akkermansiaceae bacterium]|nr:hypothetical protein [Akkermansiaceae bacterium]